MVGTADGTIPVLAVIVAAYAGLLWDVGRWLLPEVVRAEADAVLRAIGSRSRHAIRGAVVVAAVAFAVLCRSGEASGGWQTGRFGVRSTE
jgi:hypothetical protein